MLIIVGRIKCRKSVSGVVKYVNPKKPDECLDEKARRYGFEFFYAKCELAAILLLVIAIALMYFYLPKVL